MTVRLCAAVAALLAAAALTGCAGTSSSAPKNANITVKVVNGKPQGGVRTYKVKKGGHVHLVVKSDAADEVHVHGYDFHKDVPKGGTVHLRLPGQDRRRLRRRARERTAADRRSLQVEP